jgi:hypothetical protein
MVNTKFHQNSLALRKFITYSQVEFWNGTDVTFLPADSCQGKEIAKEELELGTAYIFS